MMTYKDLKCTKVLAVEGKDEVNFFRRILAISEIDKVEIIDVGGKDNFKLGIAGLVKMPSFSKVTILAIVRDSETDAQATFQSISQILTNNQLPPPETMGSYSAGHPKVGIFLMPGDRDQGMLEDFCLETVRDHPAMRCVESFFDCIGDANLPRPRILSKAKVQAFLAALPDTVNSLGLGALRDYWNLNHPNTNKLKEFLEPLR